MENLIQMTFAIGISSLMILFLIALFKNNPLFNKEKKPLGNRSKLKSFKRYNNALKVGNVDTYQGSFKVNESKGKAAQMEQFDFGMTSVIGMLYTGIRKGSIKVSPIDFDKFEGMTDDKFNMGLTFDYSIENVSTFPYDVGVLTWKVKDTRFYKIGISVLNHTIK